MRHLRLLAAVVVASAWWAAPRPALAANACTGAVICLYEHANQQGCRYGVTRAVGDLKKERFSDCPDKDVNDKVSSFSNPTDYHWAVLHDGTFSKGAMFCVRPSATGNIPIEFNDKASGISRTEIEVPDPKSNEWKSFTRDVTFERNRGSLMGRTLLEMEDWVETMKI